MNKDQLEIALLQTNLHWENKEANLAMLEEKIWEFPHTPDVIVLPEMFNTGFSMHNLRLAEPMNLTTFKWMRQQAAQHDALVLGSYMVSEGGRYFNRLLWMEPDGTYATYDKRHLFRPMGEDEKYEAGTGVLVREWRGWRLCPMICYDLRFPVWCRNVNLAYDVLLFLANWPAPRLNAWDVLLQARAIENLAYCVGVNRVGEDGNGVLFPGHSAVYDFKGLPLAQLGTEENTALVSLDRQALDTFREKFPVHQDADPFQWLSN